MSERTPPAHALAIVAMGAGGAVGALGVVVLAGWFTHNLSLIQLAPSLPGMVFNAALGLTCCGAALALAVAGRKCTATAPAAVAGLLGLATLAQHALGVDLGIDDLVVPYDLAAPLEHPGRMSLNTAVSLVLCAAGVLVGAEDGRAARYAALRGIAGSMVLGIGLVGFLGYLMDVPAAYRWGPSASMALHTSLAVMTLGTGILAWAWRDSRAVVPVMPLWAPLIALLAGLAATFMLWQAMEAQQREAANERVQNSVQSIANLVNRGMEEPIKALSRMATRMQATPGYADGPWRTDVRAYLTDFAGLLGVVVAMPDGTAASEPPLEPGRLEHVRADLATAMRASLNQAAPGAVSLAYGPWSDGRDVVYMAVPQAGSMGSVVGALDVRVLVEHVLSGLSRLYYTLRVRNGEDEVFRSAGEAVFADDEVRAALPLPLVGPAWSIELAATDGAARGAQSAMLPLVILSTGALMTLLLAAAILMGRYAQLNRLRAEERLAALHNAQGRMERLNTDLEESNRELEAFAYSVSHDLRAPLRHVAGFVELLEASLAGKGLGDQGQRYLNIIRDAAIRMGTLIDDLLAFSRVGRTQIEPVPVDLNKLVQEIRDEYRHDTRDRAIEWHVGALPTLQADRTMLRLAIGNLIGNAIKFTRPRNPARIDVEARAEGESIVVAVRDNGVGFDPKFADKLFGVFQRLHRAEEFEGTGIGLANVRRIVMRHGGSTWAESTPGCGAAFFCAFPASAAANSKDPAP